MKKNLTKLVSIFMMLVLAMSLMACGSKSATAGEQKSNLEQLSANDLIDKMSEALKDVEGISLKGNISGTVSVSGEKMGGSAKIESKVNLKDSVAAYVKANISVDVLGQTQDMTVETYELVNEDTMETYVNYLDQWTYESVELSENNNIDITSSIDFSAIEEYFDKVEVKTSGNKYNLVYEITSTNLIDKLENAGFLPSSVLEEISEIPDVKVTLTVAVDGKTFLPSTMSLGIDMDKFEVEGMEFELTDFVCEIEYESYGSVEITVPDEALEAKENGNDYSGFDLFS